MNKVQKNMIFNNALKVFDKNPKLIHDLKNKHKFTSYLMGKGQGCPLMSLLFNVALGRREGERKRRI